MLGECQNQPIPCTLPDVHLAYIRGGRIAGLDTWLKILPNRVRDVIKTTWDELRTEQILQGALGNSSASLRDTLLFIAWMHRHRKHHGNRHRLKAATLQKIAALAEAVARWIAERMDHYMHDVYSNTPDASLPVPALPGAGLVNARSYVQLPTDTIWDMLEQSRESNISINQVLKTRRLDQHVKGSHSRGSSWMNKHHWIYDQLRNRGLDGVMHFNFATDASIHSVGKDTEVEKLKSASTCLNMYQS